MANGDHLRKDGYWSGWNEYRNGPKSKKPVTLPKILRGQQRDRVKEGVLDHLRDWRTTPFENEGPMIAAIRSALCLEGHSWPLAHNEASTLMAEGLRTIGASRPSWLEGQHQYTDTPDRCSWCAGPMPEDATRLQRFCDSSCAKSAIEYRGNKAQRHFDAVQRAAYRLITKRAAPELTCEYCDKRFQSDRNDARFCSTRCVSRHQKGDSLRQEQTCPRCKTTFMPTNRGQKHCSHSCHGLALQETLRLKVQGVTRTCACCSATFAPEHDRSIYCSKRCGAIMAKRAYYNRQKARTNAISAAAHAKALSAAVFDSWFRVAA